MNDMDKNTVANQIKATFESNMLSLPSKTRYHWASRLWRITGDKFYILANFEYFQELTIKYMPIVDILDNEEEVKRTADEVLQKYNSNSEKKQNRFEVYKKNPRLLFEINLIRYLFLIKMLGFTAYPEFESYIKKGNQYLSESDPASLFLSNENLANNPSAAANSIYYLQYLGVGDFEQELFSKFKSFWMNRATSGELEFKNKIYGLTHIIIAASYFYQRFLPAERFDWITGFFEENLDEILARTNADIIAEVGIGFWLTGQTERQAFSKIQDFIAKRFDPKLGSVGREDGKNSLEKLEHRNVLAYMLLTAPKNLYEGPNMPGYLQKKSKVLYIPEKGFYIGKDTEVED